MPFSNLPYPLPPSRGLGSHLASLIPQRWQETLRMVADRWGGERHLVEITTPSLSLDLGRDAPARVRIALLADFHYDPLHEAAYFQSCTTRTRDLQPDLVFLLGDFSSHDPAALPELARILCQIDAPGGTYAILGNHDHLAGDDIITSVLEESGIPVWRNRFQRIAVAGGSLAVVAFDSVTCRYPRFDLLDQCGPGERAIVLCHEPDIFNHTARHPNTALQLSGHTHGGQVLLPLIGSPLLPRLGRRYVRGHHRRATSQLYVNRGLGTGHLHIRWRARPEITLLTLENVGHEKGTSLTARPMSPSA